MLFVGFWTLRGEVGLSNNWWTGKVLDLRSGRGCPPLTCWILPSLRSFTADTHYVLLPGPGAILGGRSRTHLLVGNVVNRDIFPWVRRLVAGAVVPGGPPWSRLRAPKDLVLPGESPFRAVADSGKPFPVHSGEEGVVAVVVLGPLPTLTPWGGGAFIADVVPKQLYRKSGSKPPNEQAKGDSGEEKLPQSKRKKPREEPRLKRGTHPPWVDTG
ncbi:hypothetical protein NFI96_004909 [Prochilodus magdalenae]|nr:hypothetical protein NFI96_004909 [Prochilodus magdalenae]